MVIRKPDGTPDDHAQGERIEAYPVQVYFLVPQERDENGVAIP
jgi:hypothetical protein